MAGQGGLFIGRRRTKMEMRDAARSRALWLKDGGERARDHRTKRALGEEE
jgi:hypothetical protein